MVIPEMIGNQGISVGAAEGGNEGLYLSFNLNWNCRDLSDNPLRAALFPARRLF
jgi:hypothetical protein